MDIEVETPISCGEICLVCHQLTQIFGLKKGSDKSINDQYFEGNMKDFYKQNRKTIQADLKSYKNPEKANGIKETKSENEKRELFQD